MASSTLLFVYVALAVTSSLLASVEGGGTELRKRRNLRAQPRTTKSLIDSMNTTELTCMTQQKLLYSDGKCYHLHLKGPCKNGEWLVLDDGPLNKDGRRSPVCKTRPCPQSAQVYWPADGQCHKRNEKNTLCPYGGNELRSDSYGDGYCACQSAHVRYQPDVVNYPNTSLPWEGICYPLYHIGPCRGGTVLHPKILPGQGTVGHCVVDPCKNLNSQNPLATFAPIYPQGDCYKLGSPCGENKKFTVHPISMMPICYSELDGVSTNSIVDVLKCDSDVATMSLECRNALNIEANTLMEIGDMMGKPRVTRPSRGKKKNARLQRC